MEYVIVLLIIALIVVLFIKQPSIIQGVVFGSLIETLQNREGEIVYGLYNNLPQHIKDKVDSKLIAEIVSFTIGIVVDVLGKKDSK